ncbi:MAG: hypothetical protein HZB10_01875 [Candidatus Yonathbacteria bacterium]|nr:hypothetical protein [Candidatus Yonathbacteria bacterium]
MLKKIREKPHHIKQSIALALTVVIFSGILFVWWSSRDARTRTVEVRESTVSPVDGVTAMFGGFMSGVKDRMADAPSPQNTSATSSDTFDLSGVVIIDPTVSNADNKATTTKAN